MSIRYTIILAVLISLSLCFSAKAETYYIATNGLDTRTGRGDWTNALLTISNAVGKAADNDIILVSNGTYVVATNIYVTNGVTLRGENGSSNTMINGNYPVTTNQCFYIKHTNAVVEGFTIINGHADSGGGVYITDGMLRNCVVSGNVAGVYGGGIHVGIGAGHVLISNFIIRGNAETNITTGGGGGINIAKGMIVDSLIESNSSTWGGGIRFCYTNILVTNCNINYNTSKGGNGGGFGGGLYFASSDMVTVTYCRVIGNVVTSVAGSCEGGGIYVGGNGLLIENCDIYDNVITNAINVYGGGVSMRNSSNVVIRNCTIVNNHGWGSYNVHGGGIYVGSVTNVIRNCLIMSNWCEGSHASRGGYGGGVYVLSNLYNVIESSTIAGNYAKLDGGGIYFASAGTDVVYNCIVYFNEITGSVADNFYFGDNGRKTNMFYICAPDDLSSGVGNITSDPQFQDRASGNYRLKVYSPCVNAGVVCGWMTIAVDLDGRIRIRYGTVDMGAYEAIYNGTVYGVH